MQTPKRVAAPSDDTRPKTSAEFFKVKALPRQVKATDKTDMPDWYYEWLNVDKLSNDFVVWHDAWPAIEIFAALDTQWRHGFDGITGLDYTAALRVIALYHPRRADQIQLFEDVKSLERGYLYAINELRKATADKADAEHKNREKH